jgi:uncharacterized membrane protein (UPF0127 family)
MPLPKVIRRILWVWGFFGALLLLILAMGIFAPPEVIDADATVVLTDPTGIQTTMPVDVADEPGEWQLGLMNRPVVERGMVFAFPDQEMRSFWMKNTLVPLDISYFESDGSWVSSATMEPCEKDPCVSYPSAGPAMYALELPAGGIGESIGSGWKLTLKYGR